MPRKPWAERPNEVTSIIQLEQNAEVYRRSKGSRKQQEKRREEKGQIRSTCPVVQPAHRVPGTDVKASARSLRLQDGEVCAAVHAKSSALGCLECGPGKSHLCLVKGTKKERKKG